MQNNRKALMIEDDLISQKAQNYVLGELGCQVINADDGETALKKLDDHYDVIFVDMDLPGLSGPTVIERIRQYEINKQPTPIIVLTTHDSKEMKQQCLAAGANVFLTKPINKNVIQKILKQYASEKDDGTQRK